MNKSVIAFATLAFVLVSCGSCTAIAAPGDGQTGMVTYNCWFVGFIFAIACFGKGGLKEENRELVLTFGLLAFISVVWAFFAAYQYESTQGSNTKIYEQNVDRNDTNTAFRFDHRSHFGLK